jgi:anti-anti-sigma factor
MIRKGERMKIESAQKGAYRLIRIEEPLKLISDLSELKSLIEGYVQNGDRYIAVNFTDASYLYSGAIAVLVNCFKLIHNRQGDLCIVEPNKALLELLSQMNIDSIMRIYTSEKDIPNSPPGV